ncbi:MAG: hypothetical protein IKV77_07680 [Alistipes sp.]|nr:hypothetical protein [Alistipes sp.]
MKKILFSAFAFVALAFASCSESGGVVEKGDYTFSGSHLLFEYNLVGDFANMVEVIPSTTLPSTDGTATPSSDGTKHSLFISNIKCPAKFDVVYIFKPKKSAVVEENKNYEYTANYNFSITRNFSDNTHVTGDTGSETLTGVIPGKEMKSFFEKYGTQTFSFTLSADGFLHIEEEN